MCQTSSNEDSFPNFSTTTRSNRSHWRLIIVMSHGVQCHRTLFIHERKGASLPCLCWYREEWRLYHCIQTHIHSIVMPFDDRFRTASVWGASVLLAAVSATVVARPSYDVIEAENVSKNPSGYVHHLEDNKASSTARQYTYVMPSAC